MSSGAPLPARRDEEGGAEEGSEGDEKNAVQCNAMGQPMRESR